MVRRISIGRYTPVAAAGLDRERNVFMQSHSFFNKENKLIYLCCMYYSAGVMIQ